MRVQLSQIFTERENSKKLNMRRFGPPTFAKAGAPKEDR